MNKKTKKSLIIIIIIVVLLFALLVLGALIGVGLFVLKNTQTNNDTDESVEDYYTRIAENNSEVSYEDGYCFVNNRIIVFLNDATKTEEIEKEFSCKIENIFGEDYSVYTLVFDNKLGYNEIKKIIEELNKKGYVDRAWVNDVLALQDNSMPKDPWKGDAWDASNPSGNNWGLEAINMPKAWESFDSDTKVKIGIIDSGIEKDHEDLKNNIVSSTTQEDSHGTGVAGIIAAEWNDIGISGIVGNNCELYEVNAKENVIIYSEYPSLEKEISYFTWLLEHCDVQVINFSQGYKDEIVYGAYKGNEAAKKVLKDDSEAITDIIRKSIKVREERGLNDFVIVCASGNTQNMYFNKNKKSEYGYKKTSFMGWFTEQLSSEDDIANYGSFLSYIDDEEIKEHIIVVGSVEHKESKKKGTTYSIAESSTRGSRVDVLAPGEDVYTTTIGNKYKKNSGTSFAAPHVSGVVAMLYAINPYLTASQVKTIVCDSGLETFDSCGKDICMIDAYECVKKVASIKEENDKDYVEKDIYEDKEEDIDLTDYSIEFDKEEFSALLTNIISYDYRKNEKYNLIDIYDIYDQCHNAFYDSDIDLIERKPEGNYENIEYYVDFNYGDRMRKEVFDSWLYNYFDLKIEELYYEPSWNFVFESDDVYYYFYYDAAYGILYPTYAYIYDIEFEENEACFKIDFYYDYFSKYKEYLNMSREEFLLDPNNEYLCSFKVYFDVKDGRMLIKDSEKLEPDFTIKYVGKASDTNYSDLDTLSAVFKKGKEVSGYKYYDGWDASWRKEGWDGYLEYYGADFYPKNSEVDTNTDEPIYVCIYTRDELYEDVNYVMGYAVFSDLSFITYYLDGTTEIKAPTKEIYWDD